MTKRKVFIGNCGKSNERKARHQVQTKGEQKHQVVGKRGCKVNCVKAGKITNFDTSYGTEERRTI